MASMKDFERYLLGNWEIPTQTINWTYSEPEDKGEEEWIWVEGYKGTDKDMKCRDYQYEMDKRHDMPDDAEIRMCNSGFHFCDKLPDVFGYYDFEKGHRFFKVKALVRRWKKDGYYRVEQRSDKMVAKSIIFTQELPIEEIFTAKYGDQYKDWTSKQKELARQTSVSDVERSIKAKELVELGYSEAFAQFAVKKGAYDIAYVMGKTPNISMDVKVLTVAMDIYE